MVGFVLDRKDESYLRSAREIVVYRRCPLYAGVGVWSEIIEQVFARKVRQER